MDGCLHQQLTGGAPGRAEQSGTERGMPPPPDRRAGMHPECRPRQPQEQCVSVCVCSVLVVVAAKRLCFVLADDVFILFFACLPRCIRCKSARKMKLVCCVSSSMTPPIRNFLLKGLLARRAGAPAGRAGARGARGLMGKVSLRKFTKLFLWQLSEEAKKACYCIFLRNDLPARCAEVHSCEIQCNFLSILIPTLPIFSGGGGG